MCFCFQHHYKYITKNAVLNKFIQNKRTFQTNVFKSENRRVSPIAARTTQFICINVLYQIAGTAFSRWYEEIKKTLKLKVGDIGVRTKVLVPLKEIMACFFSKAESPADTLGQLKQMQKGSGYDFCCLLLAFQSQAATAKTLKIIPKKKPESCCQYSRKGQKKTTCQDGRN